MTSKVRKLLNDLEDFLVDAYVKNRTMGNQDEVMQFFASVDVGSSETQCFVRFREHVDSCHRFSY